MIVMIASKAVEKEAASQYVSCPESRMMFAILELTLTDLAIPDMRYGAARCLLGDMYFVEHCGVDSDYIRRLIKKTGLDLERIVELSMGVQPNSLKQQQATAEIEMMIDSKWLSTLKKVS